MSQSQHQFVFQEGEKFALLAIEDVYSVVSDSEVRLPDETFVLPRLPVHPDGAWKEWIGTIRYDRLKQANVVLLRKRQSSNPGLLDAENHGLGAHLSQLFYLLQLSGVLEYMGSDIVTGSVENGSPHVRQLSQPARFRPTKGNTRVGLSVERLRHATQLRDGLGAMESSLPDFARIIRGLNSLNDGLQQEHGQDRLHQFVRSLEALILPETSKTKRQFIHRCQTFAQASACSRGVLAEVFDMRSDCEHLHDWDRSLQVYPLSDRENVALHRTRQIESLASFAYTRILENSVVREHFRNEGTQSSFWTQLDDAGRRTIWGTQLDFATIPFYSRFDGWGRGLP